MEEKSSNIGWIVVAIVAIVAIVGLVLLFLSFSGKNLVTGEILGNPYPREPIFRLQQIQVPLSPQVAEILSRVGALGIALDIRSSCPALRNQEELLDRYRDVNCYQLWVQRDAEEMQIPTAGELDLMCMGKCSMDELCESPVNIYNMPMNTAARACVVADGMIMHTSERLRI